MEKISIFNYEAFYLDFLEGNLSESDTALLLDFLEAHPELKVDDLTMPSLQQVEKELDLSFKAGLKKEEAITWINESNIDHYLISELEGQLNSQEQHELTSYLSKNPGAQKQRKLYASTKLVSDRSIIYTDKKALKKGTFVLWPYISLAAAASVALLIYISVVDGNKGGNQVQIAKDQKELPKEIKKKHPEIETKGSESNSVQAPAEPTYPLEKVNDRDLQANIEWVQPNVTQKAPNTNLKKLPLKGVSKFITKEHVYDVQENQVASVNSVNTSATKEDYAMIGFDEMNNPVAPITNRIGDIIKQDVDFRSAKPTEQKSGGFRIKIGKFEISHREF